MEPDYDRFFSDLKKETDRRDFGINSSPITDSISI